MHSRSEPVHVVEHRLRDRLCISCGDPHRSQPGIRVRCAQRAAGGINPISTASRAVWSYAKARLRKYHGVSRQYFPLYRKEMEFRFNQRRDDLFALIGTQLVRVPVA
jgi:transposase